MPGTRIAACGCCGQKYKFSDSVAENLCGICYTHQSPTAEQILKRHKDHEDMFRERLTKSSAWAEKAEAESKEVRQKVYWAYRSRGKAVSMLQRLNDVHTMRGDGNCSCGIRKDCKSAAVLYAPWAQMMIKRVDDYEAEQRERQRQWQELHITDEDDGWWGTSPTATDRSSDTA